VVIDHSSLTKTSRLQCNQCYASILPSALAAGALIGLQCNQCYASIQETNLEKDKGDFIIPCPACGAKNILKIVRINRMIVPTIEIAGWRE
jgi:Zn finger protein HypA/HybF involved in hydrogenase expression